MALPRLGRNAPIAVIGRWLNCARKRTFFQAAL